MKPIYIISVVMGDSNVYLADLNTLSLSDDYSRAIIFRVLDEAKAKVVSINKEYNIKPDIHIVTSKLHIKHSVIMTEQKQTEQKQVTEENTH